MSQTRPIKAKKSLKKIDKTNSDRLVKYTILLVEKNHWVPNESNYYSSK